MIVLIVPLIPLTLKYSQLKISLVDPASDSGKAISYYLLFYVRALPEHLLTLQVLMLSLISIIISLCRRDKKSLLFLIWIIGYCVQITYLGNKLPRLAIYLIPAFCLFATLFINILRHRAWQISATVAIIFISGYQGAIAFQTAPERAEGYEEAAQYVNENKKGVNPMLLNY